MLFVELYRPSKSMRGVPAEPHFNFRYEKAEKKNRDTDAKHRKTISYYSEDSEDIGQRRTTVPKISSIFLLIGKLDFRASLWVYVQFTWARHILNKTFNGNQAVQMNYMFLKLNQISCSWTNMRTIFEFTISYPLRVYRSDSFQEIAPCWKSLHRISAGYQRYMKRISGENLPGFNYVSDRFEQNFKNICWLYLDISWIPVDGGKRV